jgi:hypothetical protein
VPGATVSLRRPGLDIRRIDIHVHSPSWVDHRAWLAGASLDQRQFGVAQLPGATQPGPISRSMMCWPRQGAFSESAPIGGHTRLIRLNFLSDRL